MTGAPAFVEAWRREKCRAFDLAGNSTAGRTVSVDFWGERRDVYANANLSVYSAEKCNARCPFCVEELRPASRGGELAIERSTLHDDGAWLAALEASVDVLRPLGPPTASVTGGEPSRDPRLPAVLRLLARRRVPKRTITTNGSGLLDAREGKRVVDWIAETGLEHLNVSRAHAADNRNAAIMRLPNAPTEAVLRDIVSIAKQGGTRTRLSCVLLRGEVDSVDAVVRYVELARRIGVDNVIFRQLMQTDARTAAPSPVVRYSDAKRAMLEPLLDEVSGDPRFGFVRQVVGYYYYVEVWRLRDVDVCFEEADLAALEDEKRRSRVIHELVFHPNGKLASTWQPFDGVLGPLVRHEAAAQQVAATGRP